MNKNSMGSTGLGLMLLGIALTLMAGLTGDGFSEVTRAIIGLFLGFGLAFLIVSDR